MSLFENPWYRIATLEAQLASERTRSMISEQTIIALARLLAQRSQVGCSDRNEPVRETGKERKQAAEQTGECARCTQNEKSESNYPPRNSRLDDKSQGALKTCDPDADVREEAVEITKPQDLIDFSHQSPEKVTKGLRGNAPVFMSAKTDVQNESYDDEPPKLDLTFKNLKTANDVSCQPLTPPQSEHDDSDRPRSFEEVFGINKPASESKVDGQPATDDEAPGEGVVTKTREISQTNLDSLTRAVTDLTQSKSYRSSIAAQRSFGTNSTGKNEFFRRPLTNFHGVRYQPRESDLLLNELRVMVFNIPIDAKVTDILSRIRGGTVVSCQLLDTRFAYNSRSGMIRFASYVEAMRCVYHAMSNPIILRGQKISVQLVPTPSYPLAPEIYKNIFEHGHTRCLVIYRYKERVPYRIRKVYYNPNFIEYEQTNGCGDWFVRFTSVATASALWADIEALRLPRFREEEFRKEGFMPDPCDLEDSAEIKAWQQKELKVMDVGSLQWKI